MPKSTTLYAELCKTILRMGVVFDCKLGSEVAKLPISLSEMVEKYLQEKGIEK